MSLVVHLIKAHDVSTEARKPAGRKGGGEWTREAPPATHPTLGLPIATPEQIEAAKQRGVRVPPTAWGLKIHPEGAKVVASWRDLKGRVQSAYSPAAVRERDAHKFGALESFEKELPNIRHTVMADLHGDDAEKARIAAAVVYLIDSTTMRIGSEEYAQEYGTYGASSLRKGHVHVEGNTVTVSFTGKHQQEWSRTVKGKEFASVVRHLMKLPGDKLFQYRDAKGELKPLTEETVREYLRPHGVIPKQFRTFHATRIASEALRQLGPAPNVKQADKNIMAAAKMTAEALGNTPTICLNSYINPAILQDYRENLMGQQLGFDLQKALGVNESDDDRAKSEAWFSGVIKHAGEMLAAGRIRDEYTPPGGRIRVRLKKAVSGTLVATTTDVGHAVAGMHLCKQGDQSKPCAGSKRLMVGVKKAVDRRGGAANLSMDFDDTEHEPKPAKSSKEHQYFTVAYNDRTKRSVARLHPDQAAADWHAGQLKLGQIARVGVGRLPKGKDLAEHLKPVADRYPNLTIATDKLKPAIYDASRAVTVHGRVPLRKAVDPAHIAAANRTSRNLGAVGAKAITPRHVEATSDKGEHILDFGAGKDAAHAQRLRQSGFNVTAHEFGANVRPGIHDPNALSRKYHTVYASNVINTQGDHEMLGNTLDQIANATHPHGRAVLNLPSEPRYGAWEGHTERGTKVPHEVLKRDAAKLHGELLKRFQHVERVGGTAAAPLYEARHPHDETTRRTISAASSIERATKGL